MSFKLRIPSFLKEDAYRKLVALFFASLIWYFVNRHISEVETFKNIPVQIVPENTNQVVVSVSTPISIEVRGPKEILDKLESKDIKVSVQSSFRPNTNNVLIKKEDIKLPSGLKVENIIDKRITVDIDVIEEKDVPVRVRYDNKLSPSYALKVEPYIKPDVVTVTGPGRTLAKIPFLDTEPVTIDSNRTSDFRITTKVIPFENTTLNYNNVTAYVELQKKQINKSLAVQKVYMLYTGDNGRTLSKPVGEAFAYVSGPPDIINKIDVENDVRLFIEVSDEKKDSYQIKFWCKHSDVVYESITPSQIILKEEN